MSTLTIAIERQQWELAALCLLLGVPRAAAALPPDAVEGLLEVLETAPQRRAAQPGSPPVRKGRGAGPFDPPTGLRAGRPTTGRGRQR